VPEEIATEVRQRVPDALWAIVEVYGLKYGK
jgi:hypothetical protein